MKIRDDHMYHGAALIQIAEHPQFTAINSLKIKAGIVRSAYLINDNVAVYLKYATKATGKYKEYVFTFDSEHLKAINSIAALHDDTFIVLVCVGARETCAITVVQLNALIARRKAAKGGSEAQYQVLVTAPANKSLRVYMNQPGAKKTMLGNPLVVSRNAFPNAVFG